MCVYCSMMKKVYLSLDAHLINSLVLMQKHAVYNFPHCMARKAVPDV